MQVSRGLLIPLFALPAAAGIDFAPSIQYPAGDRPAGGIALDFDLDLDLDVIVSCRGDDELAFLRNHGNGTFAAPTTLALANNSNPQGIATGDFDHDGDIDLAVVLYGLEAVQLVLSNGNGTFTPGATFALGNEPSMIVSADFNADGWLDVAINERGAGDVAVRLNNQVGGFGAAAFYPIGGETRDVAAGDLTGDGLPDLAVSSRDDRIVRVMQNLGNGSFSALIDLSYGSQLEPHGVGLADMDSDGWLDLYSVARGTVFSAPQVFLRFNNGNPWIGPVNGVFAGVDGAGVCHGDFDLDGHVDMATCNAGSNDVSVMKNGGIGIFFTGIEYPAGQSPDCSQMLAEDLDGDGDADLVTFNEDGNDISVLINEGFSGGAYCTAGTSASGCQAQISSAGVPSATAPDGFELRASAVEGQKDGLFFLGTNGRQANPWGNGTSFQCVEPPVSRLGVLAGSGTNGACDGAFAQDLNALWCPSCPKPQKNPGVGAVAQAQLWYRDPANTSNQTTGLSDAIEFAIAP